jgi:DNA-directed RNA polymerase II subunit RPB2
MDKESISWKLIDKYFKDNTNCLVAHHLESFNDFYKNGINRIFHENNPIRFIESDDDDLNNPVKFSKKNECMLYLGGKEGNKIYYGKPVIYDDNNTHYMFPNDARLRNMTYGITIHYDVDVEFIFYLNKDDPEEMPIKHNITLDKIYLGRFPIMLQSELCILNTLDKHVRFNAGECRNDYGGYFIIDGKEKLIIPQEKFADNMLYIKKLKDNIYSYSAEIRSVSEDSSKPIRTTAVRIVAESYLLSNNQIVVSVPNVKSPVPLFILMRALGVISDKDIINTCLLNLEKNQYMVDLFIPSVHDANKVFTQKTAIEFIAELTKRGTVSSVNEILADYFLPHVGELNYLDKAYFVGYMVYRMLKVFIKEHKPTDRDNYRFKRVELTGTLLYDLFREYYLLQKKNILLKIDEEYYYHKGSYNGNASVKEKQDLKKKVLNKEHVKENKYKNNFISLIESNFKAFFKDKIVEQGFKKAFKGNWGAEAHTKRVGAVQDINRLSWYTFISHLRKINLPFDTTSKATGPRLLNSSQWGFFDPIDTPDGANIGLHKHLSISSHITSGSSAHPIIKWIRANTKLRLIMECNSVELVNNTKVFVNGAWIGMVDEPFKLVNLLKLYRRNGILPVYTSLSFGIEYNEIYIYTDAGRLTRPVYYIDKKENTGLINKQLKHKKGEKDVEEEVEEEYRRLNKISYDRDIVTNSIADGTITWEQIIAGFMDKSAKKFNTKNNMIYEVNDLYPTIGENADMKLFKSKSVVDFLDTAEEETSLIATKPDDLKINKYYTHMEIDPSLILGVMGNLVIYPEHNPLPRNSFSCGQSKQAVSVYHSNYQMRFDKMGVILNYGQTPLIKSRYLEYINNEEQPYGVNAIVAVMSYTGYNVEDAILINEGSLARGLFRTTYYSMYEAREESSTINGLNNAKFANIEQNNVVGKKKGYDYSMLDNFGLIKEGTELNDKIILIGKINANLANKDVWIDDSVKTKKGQLGVVDKSFITLGEEGFNVAKVRLREERIPAIGDKMASRSGQKGTVGLIIPEADMPYLEDGTRPDLIINPHAMPSRMTIGQIVESLFGIACVSYGGFGDCTAFQLKGSNYSTYGPMLTKAGFNHTGTHLVYNGMTGEQIQSNIYMGPTYYMRLKHMVKDKINYRARGPNQLLTRQPVPGRANDGGLRLGEMERDGVCAHGLAYFLNESFLIRCDEYYMAVCNKTGSIAIYNESKNLFLSPYSDGPIKFHTNPDGTMNVKNVSVFGRSFSLVRIPYSFKLLIQELQVMNICMRIITDDNVDQLLSMSYSNNIHKLLKLPGEDEVERDLDNTKILIDGYVKQLNENISMTNNIQPNKQAQYRLKPTFITSYEEAIKHATNCYYKKGKYTTKILGKGMTHLPNEAIMGPWGFDYEYAIRNTMDLIFNKTFNNCYLLCVNDQVIVSFVKLVPPGISNFYKGKIDKAIEQNPSLFNGKSDNLRVMGCIVKPVKQKETFSEEYLEWFEKFNLFIPDGVYILNLSDSILLRKDRQMPWDNVTNNFDTQIPSNKYLPILNTTGAEGYWDIPIPNYDDIQIVLGQKIIDTDNLVEWKDKVEKAVFRGGVTGCGTNSNTNMRIKLAEMDKHPDLDVGLTATTSNNLRFDPTNGLSKVVVNADPIQPMMKKDQANFKYIIHIDGNVAAYRLLEWMTLGSVILKVKGKYNTWVDHLLKDKEHYVSVKEDLSDLFEIIDWCKTNDAECKQIAENGRNFAVEALSPKYVKNSFAQILWAINSNINTSNAHSPDLPPPSKFIPPPASKYTPGSPEWSPPSLAPALIPGSPEWSPPALAPALAPASKYTPGSPEWSPPAPAPAPAPSPKLAPLQVTAPLSDDILKVEEEKTDNPTNTPEEKTEVDAKSTETKTINL